SGFKPDAAPPRLHLPLARITRRARGYAGRNASHSTGALSRSMTGPIAGKYLGLTGLLIGNMPQASHSRLPFRVLHPRHAVTMFSQVVLPPEARGTT